MDRCQNGRLLWYGILFVVGFAFCSSSVYGQAPPALEMRGLPVAGVILIVTLQQNAITPGDPVKLHLLTRNEGLQSQRFRITHPLRDILMVILDDKDQVLPQKSFPPTPFFAIMGATLLKPNTEISSSYPVTRAFDLNKVGTYRITAARKIFTPDETHTTDVVSNTVILHVSDRLSPDFSLTAPAVRLSAVQGDPVDVQLILRNISTAAVPLTLEGPACGYTLQMQDFRGELLPPKPGAAMGGPPVTRITLPPGEQLATTIRLSDLYDLSKPGRYFVTAMREAPAAGGKTAEIYSPTVIITITTPAKN